MVTDRFRGNSQKGPWCPQICRGNSFYEPCTLFTQLRLLYLKSSTTRARRRDRMTPHLKDLHWLPIPYRIDFKIAVLTYRCLNGCVSSYLSGLVHLRSFNVGGRVLRSAAAPSAMYDLVPPPIHI